MLETTLITKVAVLLAACMGLGGLGAYLGRKIENPLVFIGLAIAFILGTFGVFAAAHASPVLGVLALAGWTFVSGLVTAPALQHYSERLGWRTVAGAFAGTGGVMAACGAFGAFSGIDFSFLSGILFFALLGLVVAGFVTIFIKLSREGSMIEAGLGMLVFSGYFIFDFFRITKSANTWENAIQLSMSIYLDFMNFFLYLLQFIDAFSNK